MIKSQAVYIVNDKAWPVRDMEIFGVERAVRDSAAECLALGVQFGSEFELADRLGVSRVRVQRAISFLLRHKFMILHGQKIMEVRI